MKLTEALKKHMRQHFAVAEGADDAAYQKAVGERLGSGELDGDVFAGLIAEKAHDPKAILQKMIDDAMGPLTATLKSLGDQLSKQTATPIQPPVTPALAPSAWTPEDMEKAVNAVVEKRFAAQAGPAAGTVMAHATKSAWLSDENVRVKGVIERYDTGRKSLLYSEDSKHHDLRGTQVKLFDQSLNAPSQADNAVIGAFLKWQIACSKNNPGFVMRSEDLELVKYALNELPWTGFVDVERTAVNNVKLTKTNTSALINDSDSGGQTAIPVIFEQAIMMTPLLYGELTPLAEMIDIGSGTTVRTHFMARPTFTDGVEENTSIDLIDTTAFITYMDTVVYSAVAATTIGLDFEQDSLPNFGAQMVKSFGEASMAWLDNAIAMGNGTSKPEGLFVASGTTSVNAANPGSGVNITDVETFFFGLDKAFRTSKGGRNVLVGNEANYRRLRAIPAWAGTNIRMDNSPYENYMVRGIPYKIATSIPNTKVCFANMAYYSLVRRLGVTVRVETGGNELARKNLRLFVVRQRYGGRVRKGGAVAVMADLPA